MPRYSVLNQHLTPAPVPAGHLRPGRRDGSSLPGYPPPLLPDSPGQVGAQEEHQQRERHVVAAEVVRHQHQLQQRQHNGRRVHAVVQRRRVEQVHHLREHQLPADGIHAPEQDTHHLADADRRGSSRRLNGQRRSGGDPGHRDRRPGDSDHSQRKTHSVKLINVRCRVQTLPTYVQALACIKLRSKTCDISLC